MGLRRLHRRENAFRDSSLADCTTSFNGVIFRPCRRLLEDDPTLTLTVRELLEDDALGLELQVAGDIDQSIRWVHTTEQVVDASLYLEGGELILTTGVWLDAGHTAEEFVAPLASIEVAALGYGLATPGATVPDDLVRAADDRGMVLLSVPAPMPFIAISKRFVDSVIDDRERGLLRTVARADRLVRSSSRGGGIDGVLSVLPANLKPFLVGPDQHLVDSRVASVDSALVTAVRAAVRAHDRFPIDVHGSSVFPIATVGDPAAYLVIQPEGDLSASDRVAIEQCLPFLGLELEHRRALRAAEQRLAAELVDLILAGPSQLPVVVARLDSFRLDPTSSMGAVVCNRVDQDVYAAAERALWNTSTRFLIAPTAQDLVVIAQPISEQRNLMDLAQVLHQALEGSAVGVGRLVPNADGIRASLIEARHASLLAARNSAVGGVAGHADVGSHKLLLDLQDEEVLTSFRRALLEPLLEHDRRRHTQLVHTLDLFLAHGGAWQATAEKLHIHVNTLRHRLGQVERLTGRSVMSTEDRVDFFIALRAPDRASHSNTTL
jgi:PucR family transcriptional regulator, purine catabolism regulatory protein